MSEIILPQTINFDSNNKTNNNNNNQIKEFKRNKRLFPNKSFSNDEIQNDVLSSAILCPYCRERNPGFTNPDFLKYHYSTTCTTLCQCDYCDKIIEVYFI